MDRNLDLYKEIFNYLNKNISKELQEQICLYLI